MKHCSIRFVPAVVLIALSAGAASAALTGRVVDQAGAPLSDAIVNLQAANAADTTAADGRFSFTFSGVVMPAASPLKHAVTCVNGVISFAVSSEAQPVTIRVFDVSGRQAAPSFSRKLSRGEYSFDALSLVQGAASGRIFIARVSLDGRMYSYKISFQAGERRRLLENGRGGDRRGSGLSKREAEIDVLQISRTGYVTATVSVQSYDADLGDIVLTAQQYVLTILCNPAGGGSITAPASSPVSVTHGAQTTITATPGSGYGFVNWVVTSGTAMFDNSYSASTTVTLTSGNATVRANFAAITYQLSVVAGTCGSIWEPARSPVVVPYGKATAIDALPSDGTMFTGWTVTSGTATIANPNSASTTVTLTSEDATVQATCGDIKYQLTVNAGPGGTITAPASSPVTVIYDDITTITASPDACHTFDGWTVLSGTAAFNSAASASTTVSISSDATITANFGYRGFTLTLQCMSGGRIYEPIGVTTMPVLCGNGLVIKASTDACYTFSGWTVASGTATFRDATLASTVVTLSSGNATIRANFIYKPVVTVTLTGQDSLTIGNYSCAFGPCIASADCGSSYNLKARQSFYWTVPGSDITFLYTFSKWVVEKGFASIANPNSSNTSVGINGDVTISANYTSVRQ
jgi:hypothetical protein